MRIIFILLGLALLHSTVLSNDIFEKSSQQKVRGKITSYEKLDGAVIQFDNNNKLSSLIESKKEKSNKIQSNKKMLNPQKFYFHRADTKTYVSTDLKQWRLATDESITESGRVNVVPRKFEITPNPVTDFLNIQGLDGQRFEIYSIFGLKVMEGKSQWKIDVSVLPSGIYIIRTAGYFSKFIKI